MPRVLPLLLLTLVATAACGNDTTTPTTVTQTRSTEVFNGRLGVGQSQFYSFTPLDTGATEITLVSLRPVSVTTSVVTSVVGLGLGTPQGTDCALSSAVTTAPGLVKQITATTAIHVYCVKIADIGNLTGSVDYAVRIVHP